jgi:homoserine O-acetyltransferase/O-succinyltransferase
MKPGNHLHACVGEVPIPAGVFLRDEGRFAKNIWHVAATPLWSGFVFDAFGDSCVEGNPEGVWNMAETVLADLNLLHQSGVYRILNFAFECGIEFPYVDIAYETWGSLNEQKDNCVFVCHALTGDTHAGNGVNGIPGWWSELIKPGGMIDTNRFFVICANVLGGCSGSSGPASIGFYGIPYGLNFPVVTVRDMVKSQMLLAQSFGVHQIYSVIGGSLGGMQAWEWACMSSGMVKNVIAIAANASFSPLGIGYNDAMRQAITCDPNWQGGEYYKTGNPPVNGLRAARTVGMLTYRTSALFNERFGQNQVEQSSEISTYELFTKPIYQIESYLHHAGDKLNTRFDANSYLYLTRAMDSHDIGRSRGGILSALRMVQSRLVLVGISGDYLYPPNELQQTVEVARLAGVDISYQEMTSSYGHDAFLADQYQLQSILRI